MLQKSHNLRALYVTGGGIGNVVMSSPAIKALGTLGYQVDVLLKDNHPARELLIRWGEVPIINFHLAKTQIQKYNTILHSVWTGFPHISSQATYAPKQKIHEAEANIDPVRALGFTARSPMPLEGYNSNYTMPLIGGEYVVVGAQCNPDIFWRRKLYPHWHAFSKLAKCRLVFLGEQKLNFTPYQNKFHHTDLTTRTTLTEAADVIANAAAFVGIDCGLAHIAAALGIPSVVIFGATSLQKNRPLGKNVKIIQSKLPCSPCQFKYTWELCQNTQCMDIHPSQLIAALEKIKK